MDKEAKIRGGGHPEVLLPATIAGGGDNEPPDMSVLRLNRRAPPTLPLCVFGPAWACWIVKAAEAAACPVDYVVAALLPTAGAIIGNARWAQATSGWKEPPHLWCAAVGDSGQGKSPGADVVLRHIVPSIEAELMAEFEQRVRDIIETHAERAPRWERDLEQFGSAHVSGLPEYLEDDLVAPRFMENDLTIEKVASVLATAAPKGLLMARDELSGWLLGMNAHNAGARAFWIESYGGRPYRLDRMKNPGAINIPRLGVSWYGGIQPARLEKVMREADDGLLARFCWFWPDTVPFKLSATPPDIDFAVNAFGRLAMLEMRPRKGPELSAEPLYVVLADGGRARLERFGADMQRTQELSGALMASALGKARGLALRLSLVLEHLWWAADSGMRPAPETISEIAMDNAIAFITEYLMPMAERVYGDATASPQTRNAATLARWIVKTRPSEVHVRYLQRQIRLPGLVEAAVIHEACSVLVEAGWLRSPAAGTQNGRARAAYAIRPALWDALPPENATVLATS